MAEPAPVGVVESNRFGLLLVIVIGSPAPPATPFNVTFVAASRPFPTVVPLATIPTGLMLMNSELAPPAGILKPAGLPALTVTEPHLRALKLVVLVSSPPLNTTGEVEMDPTVESVLVTGTLTVKPERTCWIWTKLNEESSWAELSVRGV